MISSGVLTQKLCKHIKNLPSRGQDGVKGSCGEKPASGFHQHKLFMVEIPHPSVECGLGVKIYILAPRSIERSLKL